MKKLNKNIKKDMEHIKNIRAMSISIDYVISDFYKNYKELYQYIKKESNEEFLELYSNALESIDEEYTTLCGFMYETLIRFKEGKKLFDTEDNE